VADSDGFTDQLSTENEVSPVTYVTSTSVPGISVSDSGAISVTSTLTAGSYIVGGTSSDPYGDSAPWTYALTVNQATPSTPVISDLPGSGTYGGSFDATVSTTGDGSTSVTSSTSSVCTVSGTVVTYVDVGTCTLDAHVAAGTDHTAADGSDQSVTVTQADSTTAITSTTADPVVGQPITIGVSVGAVAPGGPAIPIGTVTVSDGLLDTCTATLDGSGNGSCSITELLTGPAVFTAVYSGDGNYNSSSTGGGTSVSVSPGVPGTPTGVTAVAGNGQATVSWTAPSDNGGSPVTGYSIGVTPNGGATTVYVQSSGVLHAQGDSIQSTFGGLTNSVAYTFTVATTNAAGTGADSVASVGVTPSSDDALITSADAGAFVPGKSFSIPLTATGPVALTKSSTAWFSVVGLLPAGVTFVPGTGKKADTAVIDGSAQYAGGPFSVLVSASNAPGTETTQVLTIYPVAWTTMPEGVTLVAGSESSFSGTVSDPDATITHSPLPLGCVASTGGSAMVTRCLPISGSAKPYRVTFTATDGKLKATATVEVTIDQAPAVTAATTSVSVTAGRAVTIALATTGFPAPTVTLAGAPSWLTVTSKKLSGTSPTSGGSWTFTVNASNGVGAGARQTITVTAVATG
jgi:hypothetical protein